MVEIIFGNFCEENVGIPRNIPREMTAPLGDVRAKFADKFQRNSVKKALKNCWGDN